MFTYHIQSQTCRDSGKASSMESVEKEREDGREQGRYRERNREREGRKQ